MRDLALRSFAGSRARAPPGLDLDGVTPPVRRRRFVRRSERYRARLALRDESDEESGSEHGGKNKDKPKNGGGGGGGKNRHPGSETESSDESDTDDTDNSGDEGSHRSPAPKPTTAPAPSLPPGPPGPQPGQPVNPGIPGSGGGAAGSGGDPPRGAGQGSDGPPRDAPAQTPAETSTAVTITDGEPDGPAQTDAPPETVSASKTGTSTTAAEDATSSAPPPLTTMSDTLPTRTPSASVQDSGSAAVHMSEPPPSNAQETAPPSVDGKKPFPLPAAAVIGAVLSFLVVSAIVWGLWFWLRRRRRARALPPDWDFAPPPKRMSGLSDSTYTVSTDVPHFISVAEAREQSHNPFAHPADERERDPFGGPAKLRRGNTLGTVSTMSV